MQALSHSPFLQALGYAITNSLWQMALLWIVVVLLNSVFRFSSALRYRIALLAQMAGFAWFIITLRFYYNQCAEAISAAGNALDINKAAWLIKPAEPGFQSRLLTYVIRAEQVLPYLSIAYLCLLVFLFIRWMRQYKQTRIIQTTGLQKIDIHWRLFVQKISAQLNIKSKVRIYLSSLVNSPLTIGFFKPIILVPLASINHLNTEQMEAVLLHELAHIKRADYLVNLIQSIIEITLFFNPFTQLLSKLIKKERENSCDDWVLQFQYNPSMYAEALLRIAYLQANPALAMHAGGAAKGDLLSRVKRMLNQKEKTFHYKQQLFALLLMTGLLSSIAWLQPMQSSAMQNNAAQKSKQPVIIEPITAKVDNPLFNPVFFLSKPLKEEVSRVAETASKQIAAASTAAMQQVQVSLARITPSIIEKIDLPDHSSIINDELNKASRELDNQMIKLHFTSDKTAADKEDSIRFVMNLVKDAIQQSKTTIDWNKIKQELNKAKTEMAISLSKNKSVAGFNNAAFNATINNALGKAFSEINAASFNWNNLFQDIQVQPAPPVAPGPPAPGVLPPAGKGKKQNIKQSPTVPETSGSSNINQRFNRQIIKIDSLHTRMQISLVKELEQAKQAAVQAAQTWSYYKPVYVEKNTDPSFVHFTSEADDHASADNQAQEQAAPAPEVCPDTRQAVASFRYKQVRIMVYNSKKLNSNCRHSNKHCRHSSSVDVRKIQTNGNNVDLAIEINQD